jgi:cystathionine beta-lyase/cystathionine gamma-synthase
MAAISALFLTVLGAGDEVIVSDVVVYSTTKYVEGHNSTVGGALLSRDEELLGRVRLVQGTVGFPQSPWEAWLTLRGLKTLPIRMERHSRNALRVAGWLEQHPQVERVVYPGLDSFPQRDLATRQQRSGGGMLTFEVRGGAAVGREVMRSVRLCSLAENLGAVETLITHPATMTHASLTEDERDALGIGAGLIRLSVGLEDAEDIIADLAQAIDCAVAIAQASGTKTSRVEPDEDASLYSSSTNDTDPRVAVPVPRRGRR